MSSTRALFAGVMSGTSLDGADALLADFSGAQPRVLGFASRAFTHELRERLLALSTPGSDSIERMGVASAELAELYAEVVTAALRDANVAAGDVTAVGCHGQTVRHRPEHGFTVQLNDPARIAERVGIDVVADFRRRDMAAGGQGAPLAPAFHRAVFHDPRCSRAVVNIGGISNITWLPATGSVLGFDCGPGNVLMDTWAAEHLGAPYDEGGRWAASGRSDPALLRTLLDDAYFDLAPPKSTGRELFNANWLEAKLDDGLRPSDVQATLLEFTARGIVDAIERHCTATQEIYVAGGGGRNAALMARLAELAAPRPVRQTDALGVPTGHVEALAFAWLAMKCVRREPIDLAGITGAAGPRILGAIYPA